MLEKPDNPTLIIDEDDQLKTILEVVGVQGKDQLKFIDEQGKIGYVQSLQNSIQNPRNLKDNFNDINPELFEMLEGLL